MLVRLCAFVVWGLVAASAVFWGLRVSARGPSAPTHAVAVGEASVTRGDLSRLLGSGPATPAAAGPVALAEPDEAGRFKLVGVMAPKKDTGGTNRYGVALIAVDGKPAKAYAVGATVDGELVLQRVSMRSAAIGPAQGAAVILEVPPLVPAATGTLPAAGSFVPGAAPVPAAVPMAPPAALPARPIVRPVPQGVPQVMPPPGASMPGTPLMQRRDGGAPGQSQ